MHPWQQWCLWIPLFLLPLRCAFPTDCHFFFGKQHAQLPKCWQCSEKHGSKSRVGDMIGANGGIRGFRVCVITKESSSHACGKDGKDKDNKDMVVVLMVDMER